MKQNSSSPSFIIYEIITTLITFFTFCLNLFFIFLFFLTSNYLFFLPKLIIIYLGIYIIMYRINKIRGLSTSNIEDLSKGDNLSKKTSLLIANNNFKIQFVFLINLFCYVCIFLYMNSFENSSDLRWLFLLLLIISFPIACASIYFNYKIINIYVYYCRYYRIFFIIFLKNPCSY